MTFEQIADFTLGNTKVPESALDMAATLLIDTLGVAAGAAQMDAGVLARNHAFAFHGASLPEHAATMIFDGRKASIPGVAFAAATQIDNLDAHDGYNPTKGHIGCAVVPALMAFTEAKPDLTGRDALAALVVAYEIAARAGVALHATVQDYHTSGAWNALGVAALGCRLNGASVDQFRQALGIAEYHGPRSQMMREIANPTMLHDGSGMGALVGCMASLMAQSGFTGAPAISVEADDVALYWDNLGSSWTIEENYIKPYPVCRWAHASLDALLGLVEDHKFSADDVAAIRVNTFTEAAALFRGMPATTSQAQYSLPFALASLLVNGHIGPNEITGDGLSDPAVKALLPRISVQDAQRHTDRFPEGRWSDVTIVLKNGAELASGDVHARGGPEAPISLGEVERKFHVIAAALPKERRRKIWAMRERLTATDVRFRELTQLIHAPVEG